MKRTNEAYFGDTFDRSSAVAYYAVDGSASACDLSYGTVCATEADVAYGTSIAASNEYALAKNVSGYALDLKDEMHNVIDSLQAQIDSLKQRLEVKTVSNELRSTLKTLQYKRELE